MTTYVYSTRARWELVSEMFNYHTIRYLNESEYYHDRETII